MISGECGLARSKFLIVRVTPRQHELFSKLAKAYGKPISTIIRESALKGVLSEATLAIIPKTELAEALGIDAALVDFLIKKGALGEPAPEV